MEAIATLAGGIAHQFNNALSVITGSLDMLALEAAGNETARSYLELMKGSTNRMAQLTSQLLAYARGGKYQARVLSLSDFVRNTLPLVMHTIAPSVQVETDLPHDIFHVKADLTQMQMVLSAVLKNASEAIEGEGRILISARNEEVDDELAAKHPGLKPGSYVCLTLEDNGKGMDEDTRSRLFEPFFTTKFQGRGLGLAAAYGIVKNHDGWISVESELGKGTAVRIYLPAVLEVEAKSLEQPKAQKQGIPG